MSRRIGKLSKRIISGIMVMILLTNLYVVKASDVTTTFISAYNGEMVTLSFEEAIKELDGKVTAKNKLIHIDENEIEMWKQVYDENIFKKHGFLVKTLTQPADTRIKNGEPEILGISPYRTPIKNPDFPADSMSSNIDQKVFLNNTDPDTFMQKAKRHQTIGKTLPYDMITMNDYITDEIIMGVALNMENSIKVSTNYQQQIEEAKAEYAITKDPSAFRDIRFYNPNITTQDQPKYIYIREAMLVSAVPTQNAGGRVLFFHHGSTGGTQYPWYFSVTVPPIKSYTEEDIVSEVQVTAWFDMDHQAGEGETTKTGAIVFTYESKQEVERYELEEIEGVELVEPDKESGSLTGTTGSGRIEVIADTTKEVQIKAKVKVYDIYGVEGEDEVTGRITIIEGKEDATNIQSDAVTGNMDPEAGGRIGAGERGKESYEVTQGIPSSEDVYVHLEGREYLHQGSYTRVEGEIHYHVHFTRTYHLSWEVEVQGDYIAPEVDEETGEVVQEGYYETAWETRQDSVTRNYQYVVTRPYGYSYIEQLEVYGIKEAWVENESLPGGEVTLTPKGYAAPKVEIVASKEETAHMRLPYPKGDVHLSISDVHLDGGRAGRPSVPGEDLSAYAESNIGRIEVRNDELRWEGQVLMSGEWRQDATLLPSPVEEAGDIGSDVLYVTDLTIPAGTENGRKSSGGRITYERVGASVAPSYGEEVTVGITGINEVVVHTPVVCYPTLQNITGTNQLLNPDSSYVQMQVENTFRIQYPYEGQHTSYKGYGNRSYADYTTTRQVKFPFDVIIGSDYEGTHVEAGEWVDFGNTQQEMDLFIPSWAEEGKGRILYRTIPINLADMSSQAYEFEANLDLNHYKAVEDHYVELSGNVQNFRVSNSLDDYWSQYFEKDVLLHAGKEAREENHSKTAEEVKRLLGIEPIDSRYTGLYQVLPLMPRKLNELLEQKRREETGDASYELTGYEEDRVMQLGYPIYFELETTGSLEGEAASIRIVPRYYYAPIGADNLPDMTKRKEVEVYVETGKSLVKLEEANADKATDYPFHDSIKEEGHRYSEEYLDQSYEGAKYIKETESQVHPYDDINNNGRYDREDYEKEVAGVKRSIGTATQIQLNYKDKGFIGDVEAAKNTVNLSYSDNKVLTSKQKWGGMFYLPNASYFVEKGTVLPTRGIDVKKAPFLHDGYIMVNFSIYVQRDKEDITTTVQEYGAMWESEGYYETQYNTEMMIGDILYYYTDKRASQTYH